MTVSVSIRRQERIATVLVTGDFDLAEAKVVAEAIGQAITTAPDGVIVDLSGTPFLDSSGIGVLVEGRRVVDRSGVGYAGHQVTGSPGHQVTGSPGHRVTGSPGHRDGAAGLEFGPVCWTTCRASPRPVHKQ